MNKEKAARILKQIRESTAEEEEREALQYAIHKLLFKRPRSYTKEEVRVLDENPGYMLIREFSGYTGYNKDYVLNAIQHNRIEVRKVPASTAAGVIVLIPEETAEEWKKKKR